MEAYASLEQYKERTQHTDESSDEAIAEDLIAAARALDFELGVIDGGFLPAPSVTFRIDGEGGSELWFREPYSGRQFFLRSFSAIRIDTTGDGSWDEELDSLPAWLRGLPPFAAGQDRPFEGLGLLALAAAPLSSWPDAPAAVELSGAGGFAAIPEALVALNVFVCRDLRDRLSAGATGNYQMLDAGIVVRDETWRTLLKLKNAYSYRLPGIA